MLSIDMSTPLSKEFTNLDLYFSIQKRLYKNFKIPEIKRKNADAWDSRSSASGKYSIKRIYQ